MESCKTSCKIYTKCERLLSKTALRAEWARSAYDTLCDAAKAADTRTTRLKAEANNTQPESYEYPGAEARLAGCLRATNAILGLSCEYGEEVIELGGAVNALSTALDTSVEECAVGGEGETCGSPLILIALGITEAAVNNSKERGLDLDQGFRC